LTIVLEPTVEVALNMLFFLFILSITSFIDMVPFALFILPPWGRGSNTGSMESEGPKLGISTSDPVFDTFDPEVDPVEAADEAADAEDAVVVVGVGEVVGGVGEVVEE